MKYRFLGIFAVFVLLLAGAFFAFADRQDPRRLEKARERVTPVLTAELKKKPLCSELGERVFIRILKEERKLELWIRGNDGKMRIFKTYPIRAMSGKLGPKMREGDRQAPEGFYEIRADSLNPNSSYHLSMNVGYPNAFDRAHKRTGSYIMIHGKAASIGCFAMGDPAIEEIYLLVEAALPRWGYVPVYIFPFAMTTENMKRHADSPHFAFWQELKVGWDLFEKTGGYCNRSTIPGKRNPQVIDGHYVFANTP